MASIREWRGHDAVDAEGDKIGELAAVYVDTSTDLPSFGTVEVGHEVTVFARGRTPETLTRDGIALANGVKPCRARVQVTDRVGRRTPSI